MDPNATWLRDQAPNVENNATVLRRELVAQCEIDAERRGAFVAAHRHKYSMRYRSVAWSLRFERILRAWTSR